MIVSKFSTLDRQQMRELQQQAAAANEGNGEDIPINGEPLPSLPDDSVPLTPASGSTPPQPPGNGFKVRTIASRRPLPQQSVCVCVCVNICMLLFIKTNRQTNKT